VDRLFGAKKEASLVVQALNEDGTLGEPLRHAARQALLRRQTSPEGTPW